jgi:hypothetical protein
MVEEGAAGLAIFGAPPLLKLAEVRARVKDVT